MGKEQSKLGPLKYWGAGRLVAGVDPKLSQFPSATEMLDMQKRIHEQYPYLTDVYESMLICDKTLPDCPIVYVNDQFEKMCLYAREEILGRNCRFLQGKFTNRATVRKIREAVDQGLELDVEILNYRKDGVPFWNRFLMLPVRKVSRKRKSPVTHFIAIQKDVSVLLAKDKDVLNWLPVEVAFWLENNGLPYGEEFIEHKVTGKQLLEMTPERLASLGVKLEKRQRKIMKKIGKLKNKEVVIKGNRMTTEQAATYKASAGGEMAYQMKLDLPPPPVADVPSPTSSVAALVATSGSDDTFSGPQTSRSQGDQSSSSEDASAWSDDVDDASSETPSSSISNNLLATIQADARQPAVDSLAKPFWSRTATSAVIAVKLCYMGEISVFVALASKLSIEKLQDEIKSIFGKELDMKYQDWEGDLIQLTSADDLANIMRIHDGSTLILILSNPAGKSPSSEALRITEAKEAVPKIKVDQGPSPKSNMEGKTSPKSGKGSSKITPRPLSPPASPPSTASSSSASVASVTGKQQKVDNLSSLRTSGSAASLSTPKTSQSGSSPPKPSVSKTTPVSPDSSSKKPQKQFKFTVGQPHASPKSVTNSQAPKSP